MTKPDRERIGLPPRIILYTVDQLASILAVTEQYLHTKLLYHEGRDTGIRSADYMSARNIAPPNEKPEWRVAERELTRWMKKKGFRFYDRSTLTG